MMPRQLRRLWIDVNWAIPIPQPIERRLIFSPRLIKIAFDSSAIQKQTD